MVREKVFVHNNAQIMERKMWQFILGSTGFILYFIYDINSVRMKNAVLQKFFAAGSILVVVSLIAELYAAWGSCHRKIGTMTGFGLGGFLFFCLLIFCHLLLFLCNCSAPRSILSMEYLLHADFSHKTMILCTLHMR